MARAIAQRIAREKAAGLRELPYRNLCRFERGRSPEPVDEGGGLYFVEVTAAFEGDSDNLRVVVTVDDFSTEDWERFGRTCREPGRRRLSSQQFTHAYAFGVYSRTLAQASSFGDNPAVAAARAVGRASDRCSDQPDGRSGPSG